MNARYSADQVEPVSAFNPAHDVAAKIAAKDGMGINRHGGPGCDSDADYVALTA